MHIKLKIYYLLIFLICFTSCSKDSTEKDHTVMAVASTLTIPNILIDSISIEVGDEGLFYYTLYSVSKIDGQWMYFG